MARNRPPLFVPDTSCLIAALSSWHASHGPASTEIERRLTAKEEMALASHTLAECYSVLTRMPPPRRLSPIAAHDLLHCNLHGRRTVALSPQDYWKALSEARDMGVAGGAVYDLLILACARRARATVLLTLNPKHFLRFNPEPVAIVVPGEG